MSEPMVIRAARAADEPALRGLDLANWSPLSSPAPAPPPARPFFRPGGGPEDVLVALAGSEIAGYTQIGRVLPLESNSHVLEVKGLTVDPAYRRRGVGRQLLEAAVREAGARGARRLTLRVLAPNEGARALYEHCGFRVEGVLRGEFRLEGRYVDDVLMAFDLTRPGSA
jgi:ribosomal protein S18 acetylase RimI-like enzyme